MPSFCSPRTQCRNYLAAERRRGGDCGGLQARGLPAWGTLDLVGLFGTSGPQFPPRSGGEMSTHLREYKDPLRPGLAGAGHTVALSAGSPWPLESARLWPETMGTTEAEAVTPSELCHQEAAVCQSHDPLLPRQRSWGAEGTRFLPQQQRPAGIAPLPWGRAQAPLQTLPCMWAAGGLSLNPVLFPQRSRLTQVPVSSSTHWRCAAGPVR